MKYYQKNGLTIEKNENIRIIINNEATELNLGDALTLKSALKKAIASLEEDEIKRVNSEETIAPMNMEFFNMGEEPIITNETATEELPKKEFKLFDNDSKKTEYYY